MKVVYLTWGETPRTSGVFGSQVINQLKKIYDHSPKSQFWLISGIPIVFSGLTQEKFAYVKEMKILQEKLGEIKHILLPIYSPQNFFYSRKLEMPLFHAFANQHLINILRQLLPDVIHCRSYHAAYASLKAREKSNLRYKVIFDARGLWPEEGVLKGRINPNSQDYRSMKVIERYLLSESDATVVVSDTMQQHYKQLGVQNTIVIYLGALTKILSPQNIELDYSHKKNKCTLCYVGALSNKTWHKPAFLFQLYKKYRSCLPNSKLLIITQSNHESIYEERGDIPLSEIIITSTKTPQELAKLLQSSSFGALPYFKPQSSIEKQIANTVIASKTAEYLAAGLPVLVNQSCGGAATLVEREGVGIGYSLENLQEINSETLKNLSTLPVSKKAIKVAQQNLDFDSNADRYLKLYHSILSHTETL